ncbi:ribonuclease P protein subunit p29-like [Antedon mediterranea]|uniref:ribonuclease P protein subunit p29-like n=1 Tax=Antedon mediterranea TaxID=105859 RepID=UPI003AF79147
MDEKQLVSGLYRGLSQNIVVDEDTDIKEAGNSQKFINSFITRNVPASRQTTIEGLTEGKGKCFLSLEKVKLNRTNRKRVAKGKQKRLTSKEKKALKLFEISKEHQKYEMYIPLHQLWLEYIKEYMLTHLPKQDMKQFQAKLLKADLHGCIMTVTKSKCPTYIGQSGILLQETRNVFKIITKEDKLKTIPKANSIFTYEFCGHVVDIYGNQFKHRSSQRSARRFKTKPTVDL